MPTPDTIIAGFANGILANTTYALPVGPHRILASGAITFSSTVGGAFSALTGATAEPGVLINGGFVRAAANRIVVCKRINTLIKTYANLVGRSNPLSYFRLGEQTGSVNYDAVGQNNLTKGSGVTLGTTGPLGDGNFAATFDGTVNGKSNTTSAVNTWFGQAAISFEAWVFNAAWGASHEMVVSLGGLGIYMSVNAAKLFMSIHIGSQFTVTSTPSVPTGEWAHIVATWSSGSNLKLYINGVAVAMNTTLARTGTLGSSTDIFVGVLGPNILPFSGVIDEVAIYLRELTAVEINNHYGARLVS